MAKYKYLESGGVQNTETGAVIPAASGNRDYREYLAWVAKGNSPDPEFTEEEQAAKDESAEVVTLEDALKHTDRALLKLVDSLVAAVLAKGLLTATDIGEAFVNDTKALNTTLTALELKKEPRSKADKTLSQAPSGAKGKLYERPLH